METTLALALAAILAATFPIETTAQLECRNAIESLSPCYGFIRGRDSFPPPDCCNRLEDVVETQPDCLCEVLDGDGLNRTRVLELPGACDVRAPLTSNCFSTFKHTHTHTHD
ncbi:hypothetical protein DH2020_031211 [Rehmannia glutinosa]|uniref:Bifunctional inhibitor/plant lipid transfer protein/seed storage helical domain-containing protein n=1 Tax=Rehmannia glutinosa TaxID=99300 RepID=A0ABR0VKA1_REHGL